MALCDILPGLPAPTQPGQIVARPVTDGAALRLGRRDDGALVLLLPVIEAPGVAAYGVNLRYVSYFPHLRAEIQVGGEVAEGSYAALVCKETNPDLQNCFLRILDSLLAEIGSSPSWPDFDEGVRRVIELFRALSMPGRRSLQGLWGEVLIMAHSADPVTAVAAWHSAPYEEFDFIQGAYRLEVKTSHGGLREHDISLDQLDVSTHGETVLVSILLSDDDRGSTLNELVDVLLARVETQAEVRLRIETILAESLGDGWRQGGSLRYHVASALSSVKYFLSRNVPAVSRETPVEVSRVRFRVDLSGAPSESVDSIRRIADLFAALTADS